MGNTCVFVKEDIGKSYQDSYHYEKVENYKYAIKSLLTVYDVYPGSYTVNLRIGWLVLFVGKIREFAALKAAPDSVEAILGMSLPYMTFLFISSQVYTPASFRNYLAVKPLPSVSNLCYAVLHDTLNTYRGLESQ